MVQNYFKDIPSKKDVGAKKNTTTSSGRSIRNIAIPMRKRPSQRAPSTGKSAPPGNSGRGDGVLSSALPMRSKKRWSIWGIAVLSVVILVAASGLLVFRDTTVTVTPREHTVVFDDSALYTAFPAGENALDNSVLYTTQTKTLEKSESVEANSVETVEERASGTLVVINDHRDSSLRLIKNTRFQTPSGLVYRIRDSVIVPGKNGNTPGELEVTVFADEPGERYNIGAVERFTLPGLKTTAPEMFDTVYAYSENPMTSGFLGERPVVDESELSRVRTQLRAGLEEEARTRVANTEGQFVFPELIQTKFESLPPELSESETTLVKERIHITTSAFPEESFAKSIAQATNADAGGGDVTIPDPSTFSVLLRSEDVELGVDPIDFSLSGKARFVWEVNIAALQEDLAGVSKETFQSVLEKHVGVDEADARIRPFWSNTFPQDPTAIVIRFEKEDEK